MLNGVYNRRIIELAGTIPRIGRLPDPDASATAHSQAVWLDRHHRSQDGRRQGDRHRPRSESLRVGPGILLDHGEPHRRLERRELRALREGVRKMLKESGAPPAEGKWPTSPSRGGARLQGASCLHAPHFRRGGRCDRPDRGQARGESGRRVIGHSANCLPLRMTGKRMTVLDDLFDVSRRANSSPAAG